MKQIKRLFPLLLLFTLVVNVQNAEAQRRGKDSTEDYFDESGGFKHRLWYGGGFSLSYTSNVLLIGVSPMVGYKFTDFLSAGPRVSVDYYEVYIDGSNPRLMGIGIGPWVRAKFSETIFGHVEYEYQFTSNLNDAAKNRYNTSSTDNFYLGLGYQSSGGGLFGYEILALYNLMEDNEFTVPISFRIGFNYNF